MPNWTKTVRINGHGITALLDTGCTKTIMHPRCVAEKDFLGWTTPYSTALVREIYFPAASVMLEVEGKSTCIAVGVAKHITQDMLMGRDTPLFRQYLKKALSTRSQKLKRRTTTYFRQHRVGHGGYPCPATAAGNLEEEEHLQQELDGPIMSALYPVAEENEAQELVSDEVNETVPTTDECDGEVESGEVLDGVITREELRESGH